MKINIAAVTVLVLSYFIITAGDSFAETKVTTFNGEVSVIVIKDGKETENKVVLKAGEAVMSKRAADRIALQKAAVSWKDIGQFEQDIVAREPFSRLYIDNIWAARMNGVIKLVREKTGENPSLDAVLEALGLPKQRPSGAGVYRMLSDQKDKNAQVPYVDKNLNEYMDAKGAMHNNPYFNPTVAQDQPDIIVPVSAG
ncbi:MAG: hypothetical protein WC592_06485 [Candidatus Omnitrophota bacterium]